MVPSASTTANAAGVPISPERATGISIAAVQSAFSDSGHRTVRTLKGLLSLE